MFWVKSKKNVYAQTRIRSYFNTVSSEFQTEKTEQITLQEQSELQADFIIMLSLCYIETDRVISELCYTIYLGAVIRPCYIENHIRMSHILIQLICYPLGKHVHVIYTPLYPTFI